MSQQSPKWMRLDNAAKIYPAASRRKWNAVFRLSATLNEKIDPKVLQSALEVTAKRFPSIAMRLKKGLFWYYLEEVTESPKVQEEDSFPCKKMPRSELKVCAFRVLYYENRISTEFFHSLTDGNGGMVFLKTLVAEYLCQKEKICIKNTDGVLDRNELPMDSELEDSFLKYSGNVSASRREPTAYKIRGEREMDGFLHITTGIIDSKEILEKAKEHKVSLTVYLISVLIKSICKIQDKHVKIKAAKRHVKILVPVNLRNFFESSSLRNFVLYVTPGINPKMGDYSFEEILKAVYHQMGSELTEKQLNSRITANVKVEKSAILKVMPLFIKNFAMKTAYNLVGESKSCLTLSNLGVITLPEEMSEYVPRMDFLLGPQAIQNYSCAVLSYKDKLYINLSRTTIKPELEKAFYKELVRQGVHVKIESNHRDEKPNLLYSEKDIREIKDLK